MKNPRLAPLALLALSFAGCQVYDYDQVELSEAYETVTDVTRDWSYTDRVYVACKDTWWDLWDILTVDASFGDGFIANAHVTRFANLGLGWFDGLRVGWEQRSSGTWAERGYEYGIGPFYWKNLAREAIYGNRVLFERDLAYEGFELDKINRDGQKFDLGARLHLAFVGVEADLHPKEFLDFFFSVGGLLYTVAIWPLNAVYDLDPPEIDLSDDNELSRIRDDLGTLSGQIYQPTTPWLERTGHVLPPVRPEGEPTDVELEMVVQDPTMN